MDPFPGGKQKCCWYPFKEKYSQRRIKSDDELTQRTLKVDEQEHEETTGRIECQRVPSMICSQGDSGIAEEPRTSGNCTSQDFWMDEVVEGGAWTCLEETKPIANQTSSSGEQNARRVLTLPPPSSPPASPKSRIEVVVDLRDLAGTYSIDRGNSLIDAFPDDRGRALSTPLNHSRKQSFNRQRQILEEKKEDGVLSPAPLVPQKLRMEPVEPLEPQNDRETNTLSRLTSCMQTARRRIPIKARNCDTYGLCHVRRESPDPFESNFYVEVEATPEQLNGVRNLEEIDESVCEQSEITLLGAEAEYVEIARSNSIRDDKSNLAEKFRGAEEAKKIPESYLKRWPDVILQDNALVMASNPQQTERVNSRGEVSRNRSGLSQKNSRKDSGARSPGTDERATRASTSAENLASHVAELSLNESAPGKVSRGRSFRRSNRRNGDSSQRDIEAEPERSRSFSREVSIRVVNTDPDAQTCNEGAERRSRSFESGGPSGSNHANERLQGGNSWEEGQSAREFAPASFRAISREHTTSWPPPDFDPWGPEPSKESMAPTLKKPDFTTRISLDDNFERPVPFQPLTSDFSAGFDKDYLQDDLNVPHSWSRQSKQGANKDDLNSWLDGDSELGTEAFKMFEGDDDDSIFNDLKTVETEKDDEISKASGDSTHFSRDVSKFSKGNFSKHSRGDLSKQSRGDYSHFSRFSRSEFSSRYSRASEYTRGVDGPFACMDKWLD